jgi:hypothetical protein
MQLLSLLRGHRMKCLLRRMLDESEFLSPWGVRALSKYHETHPYVFRHDGFESMVKYLPGESDSSLFGGNSNWRGPVWMPVNYLLVEALRKFHAYYGDDFLVECPTGSKEMRTLSAVADCLADRVAATFLKDEHGERSILSGMGTWARDEHFTDLVLFYEYIHAETGRGAGASHQTGWTGLVAHLLMRNGQAAEDAAAVRHRGKRLQRNAR